MINLDTKLRHVRDLFTGIVHKWNYDLNSRKRTACNHWFDVEWEDGTWKRSRVKHVTCLGCLGALE